MDSHVSKSETGSVVATLNKKAYTDKDYILKSVSFDKVENGVIATCSYKLKPEAEAKAKKADHNSYIDYDVRNKEVKHVFEDYAGARDFLVKELDTMI